MMPNVSVIVPNFNHSKFLRIRLESIIKQTYQNFELIILDDCSTDNSKEIIEQYRGHPKVKKIIYNDSNTGSPFIQWQKGIEQAKGELIWIAESDDYSDEFFLETLVPEFNDERVGISFCSSFWIDDKGDKKLSLSTLSESFSSKGQDVYANHLVYRCVIHNVSSAVIRKSAIEKNISDVAHYRYCGDWILYAKILMSYNVVFKNINLNYFRWYHNNTSSEAVRLGKWLDEGIHVLKFLKQSKVTTLGRIYFLHKYWLRQIINTKSVERKIKLYAYLLKYCVLGAACTLFRMNNE